MKKTAAKSSKHVLSFILALGLLCTLGHANAQFRKIPGVVTDSFKLKYPAAQGVSWSDKITSFQASFTLNNENYQAKYNKDGGWLGSEKKISESAIPASVKDGLSKSKYADWKIGTITQRYLPGDSVQYNIYATKGDLSRKNLLFSRSGQLLKDGNAL